MTEKDLISKITQLRQIKPRKDWVISVKNQILGEKAFIKERISVFDTLKSMFFQPKMAIAFLILLGLFISSLSFAYNSLPGDLLYPVKRIAEKTQALFVSKQDRPKADLRLANKRLDELTQIAQQNQTPKLAPAIDEFQKSAAEAAKNLKQPGKVTKDVAKETQKLLENKQKLETMGIIIGETPEFDNAVSAMIKSQIVDLETRSLTDEQRGKLESAKQSLASGDLSRALEKVLEINPGSSKSEINPVSSEINPTTEVTSTSEVAPK